MTKTDDLKTLQLVACKWWNASAYYAISLAEALKQAGHTAIVGGRADSPPLIKAREQELTLLDSINLESINPIKAIANLGRLGRSYRENALQLINAHRPEDMLFAALLKRRLGGDIPLVRTVSDVRAPKNNLINRWLHGDIYQHFIFSCRASYERYQAVWPIFEARSSVIYSAHDTDRLQPSNQPSELRKKYNIADDQLLVGIIARLSPVKDHYTFLKAAQRVLEKNDNIRFMIAGEASEISMDDLKSIAADMGIAEEVIFIERHPDITAAALMAAIDIGIVASTGSEVICRVAVEYMAMAIPQIVTRVNVLPEIIDDGQNGFIVDPAEPEALAKAILTLAENHEMRKKIGQTGRRYAEERFSYPVFVKQTLDVYREIIVNNEQ